MILHNIYFSAKGTTEMCAGCIGQGLNLQMKPYNWFEKPCNELLEISGEDVLLFSMSVYGAFIAEHSVFPSVATGRPDDKDKAAMKVFAAKCCQLLSISSLKNYKEISLPGTQGYDGFSYEGVPFKPNGDDKCVACGECRRICPQNAISEGDFRKTNNELCIACGACIKVCPAGARNYHSEVYEQVRNDFEKMCSEYKVPEMFYVEGAE